MNLVNALKTNFRNLIESKTKFLGFLTFSLFIFILSITVPYLDFVFTVVSNYGYDLPQLLQDLIANLYLAGGYTAVSLTLIYSVLSAAFTIRLFKVVRQKGLRTGSYGVSIMPGFIAGGCAVCGASIIPLLGFGAASALFPFAGNLWRLIAIITILYAITIIDKQSKTCAV